MPTYEMPLLIRLMTKPELVTVLKRTANTIFKTGGIIRNIENWGVKHLPYKIIVHGHTYWEANHFLLCFNAPPLEIEKIFDEYSRDKDIVRLKIYKENEVVKRQCTFHEEMLPPPYRPSVQKLMRKIQESNTSNKYKFKYNSGLDYYPFSR